MKKIYFIISSIILILLLIIKFNVNAYDITNISEVKVFNLVWEEIPVNECGMSDLTCYNLVAEIRPGVYEDINEVIIHEPTEMKLYGLIIFQYPRSLSIPTDEKRISFYPLSGSPIIFDNIDFMAVKKFTNRLELYINNEVFYYQPYDTRIEGIRYKYFIPEYDYEEGYEAGYKEGFQAGKSSGFKEGEQFGYNNGLADGFSEGWDEGYNAGKEKGYSEGYNIGYNEGYNTGIIEQIDDKDFTNLLKSVFVGIGSFLGIKLLPGITIGAIIAVPIVFGIISFILGRKKD
ncbi:MAG TPA: hypothetical protein VIK77_12450 [Tissierellaceae bacterium]